MKILVTGGSGLVGRYVVEELKLTHHVEILDIRKPDRSLLPFHHVDLLEEEAVRSHVRGFDVVVHLAGIPHPLNDPPERVFGVNTQSTYNLLEACAANEIKRLVFISSESVLGFAFSTTRTWPLYAPIDEEHETRPQDPYGLSKAVCEQLCAGFSRRTGIQTICLRPPWIWVPEPKEMELYRMLRTEYPKWYKNLWAYIHVFDVAGAIRRCIESFNLPTHDVFFITAADTWVNAATRDLVKEFYPETRQISDSLTGNASMIRCEKARNVLGFSPLYSWRDIEHPSPTSISP